MTILTHNSPRADFIAAMVAAGLAPDQAAYIVDKALAEAAKRVA